MTSIYDIDPLKLNVALAKELSGIKEIKAPEWAPFVKTGAHKARQPIQDDWWQLRAAAILVSVAKLGPIGTNKLRVRYGGRKRRGYKPSQFRKGSGSIIRTILQQLEEAKLVEQAEKGTHKGRIVTGQGAKVLAKAANTAD